MRGCSSPSVLPSPNQKSSSFEGMPLLYEIWAIDRASSWGELGTCTVALPSIVLRTFSCSLDSMRPDGKCTWTCGSGQDAPCEVSGKDKANEIQGVTSSWDARQLKEIKAKETAMGILSHAMEQIQEVRCETRVMNSGYVHSLNASHTLMNRSPLCIGLSDIGSPSPGHRKTNPSARTEPLGS